VRHDRPHLVLAQGAELVALGQLDDLIVGQLLEEVHLPTVHHTAKLARESIHQAI
jgi:hypothetical protein